MADPADTPKDVFVSGYDSAPLAPDMNFALRDRYEDLQKGFEVLGKISGSKVHLGLKYGSSGVLDKITGVEKHTFKGPHPAGNVGVQIHHVDPVNKGEVVWTVNIQDVAVIGRFFNTGMVDMTRVVAVTGPEVVKPQYVSVIAGASIDTIAGHDAVKPQKNGDTVRLINGKDFVGGILTENGVVVPLTKQDTILP